MIRREGHDPQHYTISRRGKKVSNGAGGSTPRTPNHPHQVHHSKRNPARDHDYEDNTSIMYRYIYIFFH